MIIFKNKILFLLCFFVMACSTVSQKKDEFTELKTYFNKKHHLNNLNSYNNLIVINDQGDCLNCNNKFSKAMAKNLDDSKNLFLIATSGTNVDISPYLDKEQDNNVVFDFANSFSKLNLINHSAIIKLGNQKIDSIIEIDVSNVDTTINYFFK